MLQIDMLILIDRDTDMMTPMCTQLTYEGLIDEVMGAYLFVMLPRYIHFSSSSLFMPFFFHLYYFKIINSVIIVIAFIFLYFPPWYNTYPHAYAGINNTYIDV